VRAPRVFLRAPVVPGERVPLPPDERHHLLHVLRLRPGAELAGAAPGPAEVPLRLLPDGSVEVAGEPVPVPTGVPVTLAVAPPEPARMDWIVEKAVELGAAAILPLRAARSERGAEPGRAGRWARLAAAAARQSRQPAVPPILPPQDLASALAAAPGAALVAHPGADAGAAARVASERPAALLVAVGPEGGWTEAELEAAARAGAVPWGLGRAVLRVETAALAALVLAQALLGSGGAAGA
jgi:16S rRNA (uracil1498-N3)-methyltransferase